MHRLTNIVISISATILLAFTPICALAQDKPVAVVAFSSLDELMTDVAYLTEAAGAPEYGGMAQGFLGPMTAGLDKSKPWGVAVMTDGTELKPLGFLPVTDLDTFLQIHAGNLGEAKDAGDGILQLAGAVPVFVKEYKGWAFVAQQAEQLADLPGDPTSLLDGLDEDYDIALRAYVDNVPEQYKQLALAQIRSGADAGLKNLPAEGDEAEMQRKLAETGVRQLETFFNETATFTLGWNIDGEAKSTYLDIGLTAVPGTSTARKMALLSDTTTEFGGFLQADAAATLNFTSVVSEEDIEQAVPMLIGVKQRALEQLDEDAELDDQETRDAAKDLLGSLFDVIIGTVKSGKVDGGATLVLGPNALSMACGGYVADGKQLEETFNKFIALAEKEDGFPGVEMNAAEHGGITFHTAKVPVPDAEAREIVGDEVDVVVGIGETSGYLAVGNNAADLLRKVIDDSAASAGNKVPPGQLNVALQPILAFAAAVDDNPMTSLMLAEVEKLEGRDHISIRSIPIPNGAVSRIEIEEGVLRAIGAAAKAGMSGGIGP